MRLLLICLVILTNPLSSQAPITWDWLQSQVRMTENFDLMSRQTVMRPRFEKALRKLDGKQISIKGYILPLDVDGQAYALSANPYAACFFCGGAGIESVLGLWFDGPPPRRYKTDEVVTFSGTLILNETADGYVYLLRSVQPLR